MPPADSDSEDESSRIDEYGDRFIDYGFCKRAEEHKRSGNEFFQRGRFERAIKEYDGALDQLLTVAFDKSIVVGKRKWQDIVILRSTIHLNKSACHFKLQAWQDAAREALECLHGNLRETLLYSDAQVRAKVLEAERKAGAGGTAGIVEDKLPRELRAKAWFRLSKCYANLDYLDRARDALNKALQACDSKDMLTELTQHEARIQGLERRQHMRQKEKFRGFFEKLQDRGGYLDARDEVKARWSSMSYDEKLRRLEELDGSEDEDPVLAAGGVVPGALAAEAAARRRDAEAPASALAAAGARRANLTFEEYFERQESTAADAAGVAEVQAASAATVASSAGAARPAAAAPAAAGPAAVSAPPSDVARRRQEDFARREQAWKERQQDRELDDLEEEELRKARERLARARKAPARSRRPAEEVQSAAAAA